MATKIVRALFAAAACTIFMIATPVALWLAVGFLVLLGLFLRMLRLRRRVPALLLALVLLLPNLRWGASILALRLKEREALQAMLSRADQPESIFIQNEVWEDKFVNNSYDGNNPYRWQFRWDTLSKLERGTAKALAFQAENGQIHLYRPAPFYAASRRCEQEKRDMQDALDALTEKTASSSPQNPEEHEVQLEEARRLRLRVEKKGRACYKLNSNEIEAAYQSAEIFTDAAQMPPMSHRIHVWQKDRYFLGLRLYRLRQLDIYDNKNGRRIAWARAYYRDTWWGFDFQHAVYNVLSLMFPYSPCYFVEGPGVRLENFAEEVLFSKPTPQPNAASQDQRPPGKRRRD